MLLPYIWRIFYFLLSTANAFAFLVLEYTTFTRAVNSLSYVLFSPLLRNFTFTPHSLPATMKQYFAFNSALSILNPFLAVYSKNGPPTFQNSNPGWPGPLLWGPFHLKGQNGRRPLGEIFLSTGYGRSRPPGIYCSRPPSFQTLLARHWYCRRISIDGRKYSLLIKRH